MKNNYFHRYYLFSCLGVLVASCYPLFMGARVITDMISDGTVMQENYPKYMIPYTPICLAILAGVLLLPLCIKRFKQLALIGGSAAAVGVFFFFEILFEQMVIVTADRMVTLENWQMYMCYLPSKTTYATKTAVEILMGEYTPAFKLHFYMISVVLILSILNCLYGFGQMIITGEKKRLKSLLVQSICVLMFLGLCILACFTAFWRDGKILVSPLSAAFMAGYFILFGVTVGSYVGSLLLGKRKLIAVYIPAIISSIMTSLMYVGETVLLHGYLYRFGKGFFFERVPGIILAPVDLLIILASGCVTILILKLLNRKKDLNP